MTLPIKLPANYMKDLASYLKEKYSGDIWCRNIVFKKANGILKIMLDRDVVDLVSGQEGTCRVEISAFNANGRGVWDLKVQSKGTIYARSERIVYEVADVIRKDIVEWFCAR